MKITISSNHGETFTAYLKIPASTPAPGLIIIQEIFGVNEVMRNIADRYAEAGYVAIVPDLFWRQESEIELTDKSEEDWQKAFELYQGFDENKGVDDLISTMETIKNSPECSGKIGSVGFCLGGKLAYLMATRSPVECNVSYYGVGIEKNLNEAANIQHPLMLHIAEKDEYVSPEIQSQLKGELQNYPLVEIHSYPNVNHGFARIDGKDYDLEATNFANSRTMEFFQKYLG
ncbi:MAG: dienelactone hydrolase family protein [Cyanobacteria bacterium P01_H01_bin.35]